MPKREDEYWAGRKENLKLCPICRKRLIRADLRMCQPCLEEELARRRKRPDTPEIKRCPNKNCRQLSVTWNSVTKRYECLNRKCNLNLTEEEFQIAEQNAPPLQNCPKCGQETVTWVEFYSLFQCVNPKCKRCFTETELRKRVGHEPAHEEFAAHKRQIVQDWRECPECGQELLVWNPSNLQYECLNAGCKQRFKESQLNW